MEPCKNNSLIVCVTFLTLASFLSLPGVSHAQFVEKIEPIISEYCFDCHDSEMQEGGIRLDNLTEYRRKDQELWNKVFFVIEKGEMPPKKKPQPTPVQKQLIQDWVREKQEQHRTGSTRRLNRRELSAALNQMTGLNVDYASALPEDGKVKGFDTGGSALQDAADSISQVLEITRRAINGIKFSEQKNVSVNKANFSNIRDVRKSLDHWKMNGLVTQPRGQILKDKGILMTPKWLGDRGDFSVYIPKELQQKGLIRIKLTLSSTSGKFPNIPKPHFWLQVGGSVVDRRVISNTPKEPITLEYQIQIDDLPFEPKGLKIMLHNKVEMPYSVVGFPNDDRSRPNENIPGGTGLFRPKWDRKVLRYFEDQPVPFVVLHSIEVETDYQTSWPPSSWGIELSPELDDEDKAKKLLSLWIQEAWRRPTPEKAINRFFNLYKNRLTSGASFDESLKTAFHSVLMSAPFRYLSSPRKATGDFDHYDMASRLSFMLTGSPPDQILKDKATQKLLQSRETLDEETRRLIASEKNWHFIEPFVKQWLVMDQPITVAMDHIKKQDFRFGRFLKESMQQETLWYFREILTNNKPVSELLDSNWTMMNNSLARHYNYPTVEGAYFRPVKLRNDDPRGGGMLSHAGIQSMLTWMGDNWVIYRGAWALRHILDDPPPPPPLDVPELNPSEDKHKGKTYRELLKIHQEDPNCSVCHKSMDPLGFAFQNFDLSGRWRDVEFEKYKRDEIDGKIVWIGAGKSRPVDASGHLPKGEVFTGYSDFKSILASNYSHQVAEGILKNLFLYGTGNQPDVDGIHKISNLVKTEKGNQLILTDLIVKLIQTESFQY